MSASVQLTGRRLVTARVMRSLAVILLVLSTLGWLVDLVALHTLIIALVVTCLWIWIIPSRKAGAR